MLILTIGLFYSDRIKEVYATGMAVLAGGHGAAAWGRFKTKAGGGDAVPADDSTDDPKPATGSSGEKG